jgi:hypothetical protein
MADSPNAANQLVSFFHEQPKKLAQANALGIELLPMQQKAEFSLAGPAVAGVIYVRHPLNFHELVTFADYDERLAQDRYEEALRVFTSLGAARIVATSSRQTAKRRSGRFRLAGNGVVVSASKDASVSLAFDQEGDGGKPVDPRPLRFRDIAGLGQICESVLRNGCKKGRIQITKSSALGIDGDLAGRLQGAGFELGLSGTRSTVTEFVIEAAFTKDAVKDLDQLAAQAESESRPSRRNARRAK